MSTQNLASWKRNTASVLIRQLPLQTADSALVLVENYLNTTGGWIPDDELNPTGFGVPASGATNEEAATAIETVQLGRIYKVETDVTIQVRLTQLFNLNPGLDDESVVTAADALIRSQITNQIGKTSLELISIDNIQGELVEPYGILTPEDRAELNTNVESPSNLIEKGLQQVRFLYGLDNKWNVDRVYIESGKEPVMSVRKYTNLTYQTIDSETSLQYVITVNSETGLLTSGMSYNRSQ